MSLVQIWKCAILEETFICVEKKHSPLWLFISQLSVKNLPSHSSVQLSGLDHMACFIWSWVRSSSAVSPQSISEQQAWEVIKRKEVKLAGRGCVFQWNSASYDGNKTMENNLSARLSICWGQVCPGGVMWLNCRRQHPFLRLMHLTPLQLSDTSTKDV